MSRSNTRLTFKEISEYLNISYVSVQNILTTDLNIRKVSAKFVPRNPPSWQCSVLHIASGTAISVK